MKKRVWRCLGFGMAVIVLSLLCLEREERMGKQEGVQAESTNPPADFSLVEEEEKRPLETPGEIRVLLKTSNYSDLYHERVELVCDREYWVSVQDGKESVSSLYAGGEILKIDQEGLCEAGEGYRIWQISPKDEGGRIRILSIERELGNPSYGGGLRIICTERGFVLINVLSLEEYLYSVVPSEMPAGYPMEALKAQAICARTYAYGKMIAPAYPDIGADLDDSVQFQVYQNLERQERTDMAVQETCGVILRSPEGAPAQTYYYSTSGGWGTDESVWGISDGASYLQSKKICRSWMEKSGEERAKQEAWRASGGSLYLEETDPDDYEWDQPWYRWTVKRNPMNMEGFLQELSSYLSDGGEEGIVAREIKGLSVSQTGEGGAVICLRVDTDFGSYYVRGEHPIRELLCDEKTEITRGDGVVVTGMALLPSAFFLLETSISDGNVIGYTLKGGGLGHGIGMSQNAAKKMAEDGKRAQEILGFFYEHCEMCHLY